MTSLFLPFAMPFYAPHTYGVRPFVRGYPFFYRALQP